MEKELFDVVIIGAGPSGASCAIKLSGSGRKVLVLDKAVFPRDKICGDALSPDILNQLTRIDPALRDKLESLSKKSKVTAARIFAPSNEFTDISLPQNKNDSYGYVVRRMDFDHLMTDFLKEKNDISLLEGVEVNALKSHSEYIEISTNKGVFYGKIVVGADGAHSIVTKTLMNRTKIDKKHYAGALRIYYKNVKNSENPFIELHFIKEVLPGYIWVFPLSENEVNLGIGMLSDSISKDKVNLKKLLDSTLQNHPAFKERFAEAIPLEKHRGFGLPLGGKRIPISGHRFLLTGDAASIIDPLTGEGIGNAIRSGRFAAEHILQAMDENNYSANFNKQYDKRLYKAIMGELTVSRYFQLFSKFPFLINKLVHKLNTSKAYQDYIHQENEIFMLNNKWKMTKFIFRFLFGR